MIRKTIAAFRTLLEDRLPEDPWRYFQKVPGAIMVPVDKLQTIRARSTGIAHASEYMRAAYNGKDAKRMPITVIAQKDGTYTVDDGNSTTAIAKANHWEFLPAILK